MNPKKGRPSSTKRTKAILPFTSHASLHSVPQKRKWCSISLKIIIKVIAAKTAICKIACFQRELLNITPFQMAYFVGWCVCLCVDESTCIYTACSSTQNLQCSKVECHSKCPRQHISYSQNNNNNTSNTRVQSVTKKKKKRREQKAGRDRIRERSSA